MRFSGKIVALLMIVSLIVGASGSYAALSFFGPEGHDGQKKIVKVDSSSPSGEVKKVRAIHDLIEKNYFKKVDEDKLYDGAIQGMIKALDDPFSTYMDPKTAKDFNQSLSSSFQGIGAEVRMVNNVVSIVAPIKGSPAEKAGLKPHDQIVTIDGKSTKGLSLYKAVNKIKGKKGTVVKLGVNRPGVTHTLTFEIKRGDIPLRTVKSKVIKEDNKQIGYINITSFNANTDKEFNTELKKVEDKGIDGLIIDVRGNPGGYLQAVESIAGQFITKDKPIVQIEDRNGKKERYFSSLEEKKPYPIAALIDNGSASAAEILSAALNEAGGYPLIGTKSFGKGTVQQGIEMSDNSELKLTTFKWLTPDGNWIHKKGIKPTVKVKQPDYFYTTPITLDKGKVLGYDHTGTKIANAQKMLKGLGLNPGRVDGYYGEQTVKAVRAFQETNDLHVTGSINKKTAGKLQTGVIQAVDNPKNDLQLKAAIKTLEKEMKS
ncbi:carboxyl-terminal processing protease [Scopulibacillus darangshiensis]|uniref:Carboxyl-terminal processing protease n=1 Tax=Scopulibacillus darangshiensis TaxID=442528 RepID=A0A4R2NTS6_9BACL|nr:S41 family peptidase [Scopulibacillus darangshiensis]TCP24894.1 carboxyl-terminal processing protease [Scopulibacillus darangshiensis]